jgi:hypothetical protein
MIAALLGDIWPYLIAALAAIGTVVGAYLKGGSNAKAKQEAADAKAAAKAHEDRRRIEDDIEQDDDLAGRARRAGVVRPGSE